MSESRPGRSTPAFLLLLAGVALLGFWLRPRVVYELWEEQALESDLDGARRPPAAGGTELTFAGIGVLDADGDGRQDLVFSRPPDRPGDSPPDSGPPDSGLLLFRNLGKRRFADRTREAALVVDGPCRGVGVGDFDADSRPDIFVSSFGGNLLFVNDGGRFREVAAAWGADGAPRIGGAVAVADFDGDGRLDAWVSAGPEAPRAEVFYLQRAPRRFDRSVDFQKFPPAPLDPRGDPALKPCVDGAQKGLFFPRSGMEILDLDNDGDLDVYLFAGAAARRATAGEAPRQPERDRIRLNDGGGAFKKAGRLFGPQFSREKDVDAAVSADLDGDGRLDLILSERGAPPVILWNGLERRRWLRVRLERDPHRSPPRSPPEGLGARLEIEAGGRRQVRWLARTGGRFSCGDAAVHFGLDRETKVSRLRILWPSGQLDQYEDLAVDREYLAREGASRIR